MTCLDSNFSEHFDDVVDEVDDGDVDADEFVDDSDGFLSLKQNVHTFKSFRFVSLSEPMSLCIFF
jgi:hypothetical protein